MLGKSHCSISTTPTCSTRRIARLDHACSELGLFGRGTLLLQAVLLTPVLLEARQQPCLCGLHTKAHGRKYWLRLEPSCVKYSLKGCSYLCEEERKVCLKILY